jgi:hypothetical protein
LADSDGDQYDDCDPLDHTAIMPLSGAWRRTPGNPPGFMVEFPIHGSVAAL